MVPEAEEIEFEEFCSKNKENSLGEICLDVTIKHSAKSEDYKEEILTCEINKEDRVKIFLRSNLEYG